LQPPRLAETAREWRDVRVRQQWLHDQLVAVASLTAWIVLAKVLYLISVTALVFAHALKRDAVRLLNDPRDANMSWESTAFVVMGLLRVALFVGLCSVVQCTEDEVGR
jgi:hypothetical protein